jgi:hypothetical protein
VSFLFTAYNELRLERSRQRYTFIYLQCGFRAKHLRDIKEYLCFEHLAGDLDNLSSLWLRKVTTYVLATAGGK